MLLNTQKLCLKMNNLKFKISKLVATFFYVGLCPIAPGTAGSLASLILIYFLPTHFWPFNALVILILLIIGVVTTACIETTLQIVDPSWAVIDEVLGMYLTVFWMPKNWIFYAIGFALFRFFDITKLYPIKHIEAIKAPGWGIMLDDVAAAVYASLAAVILLKLNIF
ncbi:MAG: Phosphatidylglycerophosphatase A [candidate division TM6 bacterium GW2011_GWF2_37_49]|nr:MAG: Phosphatidylglycerophosphatase A [candidate division TM6 bacterium GW2011_GWF2_37_49]